MLAMKASRKARVMILVVRSQISFYKPKFYVLGLVKIINLSIQNKYKCIVCFVALRPKSTAMVMAEPSVHLTTLFPGQA